MVRRVGVCLVVLLTCGASAWANAGTPLMWLGFLHLFFGNFLIGVWEALVLARRFHLPKTPLWLMVAANYVSAVAGLALLSVGSGIADLLGPALLMLGIPFLLTMLALAFALTAVVEWPFCLRLAGDGPDRKRLAWRMSLTAQAASYAILVPLYLLVSPINALFHARPLSRVAKPPVATVYYLTPSGSEVWRVRTDGTGRDRVMPVGQHSGISGIGIVPGPKEGAGDLVLFDKPSGSGKVRPRVLRAALAPPGSYAVAADVRRNSEGMHGALRTTTLYFLPAKQREWTVEAGFWPAEGISFWKKHAPKNEDQLTTLALETPYVATWLRNVTVMPNNQAVLQAGNVIVLLDVPTRRLAAITRGVYPVVVLEAQNEN